VVTDPVTRTIAGSLLVPSVDVRVSDSAPNTDPGCPTERCAEFFRFLGPDFAFGYGMASNQLVRLLFAPVTISGKPATMLIMVDPGTPEQMDSFATDTGPMLDGIRISDE
jgi:hypothetical protein